MQVKYDDECDGEKNHVKPAQIQSDSWIKRSKPTGGVALQAREELQIEAKDQKTRVMGEGKVQVSVGSRRMHAWAGIKSHRSQEPGYHTVAGWHSG